MIKVSIIVPIYNSEEYLEKCLDSLINQTLKDIEIILINDGSTDNSEKIIKQYKDKRIIYIKKENEGIGITRNKGINIAKGQYISFIDSDDYIDKNFCKKMYEKAINDDLDIVMCNYYEDATILRKITFNSFQNTNIKECPSLINIINLGPCNKIFKKTLFDENTFFEEKLKYEDAPFVIKMICKAKKVGFISNHLHYYVIHENSQTTLRDSRILDILEICKIIRTELEKNNIPNDEKIDLLVKIITDYTIQSKYLSDKKQRNRFITSAFKFLNESDRKWRKCSFLKKISFIKRKIKTNLFLTKIYCNLFNK